jgi:hypothetical protein
MNAIVNDESEIIWKETTLIYFNVLKVTCITRQKKNPLKSQIRHPGDQEC